MITKVRIAPMEKWCPSYRRLLSVGTPKNLPGLEVEIETTGMEISAPDNHHGTSTPFKLWPMTQESIEKLNAAVGAIGNLGPHRILICEHLLDID